MDTVDATARFGRPNSAPSAEKRIRALVGFALAELPVMRHRDGMYCVELHADDMHPMGRSIRYSAMVALGLLRARSAGIQVGSEPDDLTELLFSHIDDPALTPGDVGLLLWVDQRARRDRADHLLAALERSLQVSGGLAAREGMEVAWIAIAAAKCVEQGLRGPAERALASARAELLARTTSSGLLLHRSIGWRRRFPNFATQIYGILALATLGGLGDQPALTHARAVGDVILRLQRADGGWPWLFDALRGRVADPYEVYAVHQDAMAPMGLFELHEVTGDDRYRAAAVSGLDWIYCQNDLNVSMLDKDRRILYRSIRRQRPWDRATLFLNTATSYAGRPLASSWGGPLEVNRTDRPYHLGWVLEAWCGREELASVRPFQELAA